MINFNLVMLMKLFFMILIYLMFPVTFLVFFCVKFKKNKNELFFVQVSVKKYLK